MQISSVLRLGFARSAPLPQPQADEAPAPTLHFRAYGEDCVVSGSTELVGGARLTDMLNHHDAVELASVSVEPNDGNRAFHVHGLQLARDDILLVAADSPRGDAGRRTRTRAHGVSLQIGPYLVHGYVHALPGADPLAHLHRRAAMVPLTDARVEYQVGGEARCDSAAVLIVNRGRVSRLSPAVVDDVPDSLDVAPAKSDDPRVKDFTGELRTWLS